MSSAIETIVLGMGCFWGAEKHLSTVAGVTEVESGYANGEVAGRYEAVLEHERLLQQGRSTLRNHAEVVKVSFDPAHTTLETVLARFWESHDPTQGDRQGNDIGSNYRSAIYLTEPAQHERAMRSRDRYQDALTRTGFGRITTEIAMLESYFRAEDYHQQYLRKNPHGYCGVGGLGIRYPLVPLPPALAPFDAIGLVACLRSGCAASRQLRKDILNEWRSPLMIETAPLPYRVADGTIPPPVLHSPTVLLVQNGEESARYEGYDGDPFAFWQWLGQHLLSPDTQRIAFRQGTEAPFSSDLLEEQRAGWYLDPLTGAPLFRSATKFDSACGWPSFFDPVPGALSFHQDDSHGMRRTEVRSASSGIHLGHVFDDGPRPTGKRYCINGQVLLFVADDTATG